MNALALRLFEMIGLTILHSLWQITLLWIVLISVLRLCPRASSGARYTLALSILMLSVLSTAGTAIYEWQLHASGEAISALPGGTSLSADVLYITIEQTVLSRFIDALNASIPMLPWLWCAGLLVMGVRFSGSFFYLRTLRAQQNITAVSPVWEQELKRLSRALGFRSDVSIAASARISSPLTLGSISPIILVPAGLLTGMSTAQIEAILVHELYHIKRRDYIINICQALIEVLLFYHPALWHINNIIRQERENCCDDKTVAYCGDAISYARALTHIQEINSLPKPTLAMSATGTNAGNFTHRIKRLFHIYPDPAQSRSKGFFAICFLLVYLSVILASANVFTAHAVKPEKMPIRTSVIDDSTFSDILPDTLPLSNHLYVPDEKKITPQPAAGEKIHPIGTQRADTARSEQTLAHCLQQVNLMLKMASLYRFRGDTLRFSKFSAWDSLWIAGSMDNLVTPTPKFQPTRFSGSVKLSRMSKSDLIDSTGNGTTYPIKFTKQEATPLYIVDGVRIDRKQSQNFLEKIAPGSVSSITVYKGQQAMIYGDDGKDGVVVIRLKPRTAKEILIPRFGITDGSVKIFAGGTPLKEGTDYSADYISGKVIIKNETILNSGKNISVQYDQADPSAFQKRSLVDAGVDYHVSENVNAIQVFPNATNGHLNITFTPARNHSRVKMVLVDLEGKLVKEITDSTYDSILTELHVDVSSYKHGIYILQINIDGARSQQRVVVE